MFFLDTIIIFFSVSCFGNLLKIGADTVARATLKSQGVDPDSREGRLIKTIAVEGMLGDSSKSISAMREIADDSQRSSSTYNSTRKNTKQTQTSSRNEIALLKAKKGDLKAILYIANSTYYGTAGFKKDYYDALKFFKQAERQGDSYATGVVGMMLYHGIGVKADRISGFSKLQKAAEANDQLAQISLTAIYMTKENKNFKNAIYWASKQVRQGDNESTALYNSVKANLEFYGNAYSQLIFQEHSFEINFEKFGKAKFEIVTNDQLNGPYYKLIRYRLNAGKLMYYLPVSWDDGPYNHKVRAVAFKDLNGDGLKDICIMSEVLLSRYQEIEKWNENGIWFATQSGQFVTYSRLNDELTEFDTFSQIRKHLQEQNLNIYLISDARFGSLVDPHDNVTIN